MMAHALEAPDNLDNQAAGGIEGASMRFVVMTCRKDAGSQPLLKALAGRGVTVAVATEAPTVIAQLAAGGQGALIIDEPSQFKRLAPLLAVVRRYMPHIVCRQYTCLTPDGRPRLAQLSDDYERYEYKTPSSIPDSQPISGPLISKQELAMLIGNPPAQTVNTWRDSNGD